MIHQCTRCELRFRHESELADHLRADHGVNVTVLDRNAYPAAHPSEPLYRPLVEEQPEAQRVLVVANRTVASPTLIAALQGIAATGPATFVLLVPAPDADAEDAAAERLSARRRLEDATAQITAAGLPVRAELGVDNPVAAVGTVLERERIDSIVVSTLPSSTSAWLQSDLPSRLSRRFGLPVRTVTSPADTRGVTTGLSR